MQAGRKRYVVMGAISDNPAKRKGWIVWDTLLFEQMSWHRKWVRAAEKCYWLNDGDTDG